MNHFSSFVKSFKEISEEYDFTKRSTEAKSSYFIKLIAKGWKVPSAGMYYFYSTLAEANELSKNLQLEVDRKYTLELISAFEAKLVFYFKNLKTILKRSHKLYKSYEKCVSASIRNGDSPLMYKHILLVFKQELQPIDNIAYSNLKTLIEFRNWLAHGRAWNLESHLKKFDFEYSLLTIESIISFLPKFPSALK